MRSQNGYANPGEYKVLVDSLPLVSHNTLYSPLKQLKSHANFPFDILLPQRHHATQVSNAMTSPYASNAFPNTSVAPRVELAQYQNEDTIGVTNSPGHYLRVHEMRLSEHQRPTRYTLADDGSLNNPRVSYHDPTTAPQSPPAGSNQHGPQDGPKAPVVWFCSECGDGPQADWRSNCPACSHSRCSSCEEEDAD
jgi:hypothetical protein